MKVFNKKAKETLSKWKILEDGVLVKLLPSKKSFGKIILPNDTSFEVFDQAIVVKVGMNPALVVKEGDKILTQSGCSKYAFPLIVEESQFYLLSQAKVVAIIGQVDIDEGFTDDVGGEIEKLDLKTKK